jgi:hypothetical protein
MRTDSTMSSIADIIVTAIGETKAPVLTSVASDLMSLHMNLPVPTGFSVKRVR